VAVSPVEIDGETLDRAIRLNTGVAVLPKSQGNDKAIYSEASVMLVKELRALGAAAEYLDPPDDRVFEVKKGHVAAAVLSFVLGIASTAAWDAVKIWLAAKPASRLSVTYVDLEDIAGRRRKAWRVEGDTAGVLEAIDRLRGTSGPQEIDGPEVPE
jgi:hypothetical protein